jgi:tetratricopeptide (TPR) repeat protein
MPFRPRVNESISANSSNYTFTEHPSAPNMAYGQTGRRATVYQLRNLAGELYALKVFTKAWRDPRNATGARQLASFAHLPGLQVCNRSVFTPHSHADLIATYPDLDYAVLMAWVCGETWQEVLLNGQPLTVDQSRELGLAFLGILISMEQAGLAHCDLSGPNVLLQFSPPQAALVDLEDLFGPGLSKPDKLPGGSSGYGHKTALGGLWSADADRFAGAILLAEILGWCDERVRRISYGEQYFDPAEVQQSSERYQLLLCVLHEQWGDGVAHAFTRAWFSERLEDCPSFQEWDSLLNPAHPIEDPAAMEQLAQAKIDDAEEMLANDQHDQAVVSLEEAYQVSPKAAASTYARGLLTRGAAREREGDLQGALADYQMAFQIAPEGGLRNELKLILAELEPVAEPDEAAPVIFDTEVLETELVATIEPVPVEETKVPVKDWLPGWLAPLIILLIIWGVAIIVQQSYNGRMGDTQQSAVPSQVNNLEPVTTITRSPSEKLITVPAKNGWIDTGISVVQHQFLSVKYISGTWTPCDDDSPYVDARGETDGSKNYADNIIRGCYHGALIGRIGDGSPFCVNSYFSENVKINGRLQLSINDTNLTDDDGEIVVEIRVK